MGDDSNNTQRRERTQDRAKRTHARLLQAAALEISQHGYENASVARIAKEAGVTQGAAYSHFKSKWAIAQELLDHQEAQVEALAAHVQEQLPSAFERLLCFSVDLSELLLRDIGVRASIQLSVERDLPMEPAWQRWVDLADELVSTAADGTQALRVTQHLGLITVTLLVSAWLLRRDQDEGAFDAALQPLWSALTAGLVLADREQSALASVETIFGR